MLKRLIPFFAIATALAQEPSRLDVLVATLGKIEKPEVQASILKGMRESLQGQRGIPAPKGWDSLYAKLKDSADESVRSQAQALAVIFGGGAAMEEMRAKLADGAAPAEQRRQAMDALVAQRDTGALEVLLKLLNAPGPLREPALRGLAGYDDARIAPAVTESFTSLDSAERRAAVQTLLARVSGARAFIAAVDAGIIPKSELNAPLARQLDGLKNAEVSAWLAKNWGMVSEPSGDKQKLIAKYKEFTGTEAILRADANRGRAIFAQSCAVCHVMFGAGGHIGPELTGGYEDVDYLLNNILDPNAIIGKDYQQTFVKTKDGRTVAGIVTQDTESAISMKMLTGEVVVVQKSDVAGTEVSPLSMMPDGLLATLDEEGVRDLFLYLRQKQQVPALVGPANAHDFFNGADLKNWRASSDAWRVEEGAISLRAGARAESLTSEMVAAEYRLTAQVQAKGPVMAEFVLSGGQDAAAFHGTTLSLGGGSRVNLWSYRAAAEPEKTAGLRAMAEGAWHALEIVRKAGRLTVSLDGKVEFDVDDDRRRRHVATAIHARGEGGELRIKALKIEAL